MTTAETIAAKLADGTTYTTESGERLEDLCEASLRCSEKHRTEGWPRWFFADGSSIIDYGAYWDIALGHDCWCPQGAGHTPRCTDDTDLATRVGTAIGTDWCKFGIGSRPMQPIEQDCYTFRAHYPAGYGITHRIYAAFYTAYAAAIRG